MIIKMALASIVTFFVIIQCLSKYSLMVFGNKMPYEGINEKQDEYQLLELPYKFDALEPHIDCATVDVHYNGHHAAYTKKMNIALSEWRGDANVGEKSLAFDSILQILTKIEYVPEKYRNTIRNNGGGFVNHNIYWSILSPNPTDQERKPREKLLQDIENDFGSYRKFVDFFTNEASTFFGSGYVWLARQHDDNSLVIHQTNNQVSPLSEGLHPIAVIDVWEHAYYLKHQNRRSKHISDWWKLLDWERVSQLDEWWLNKSVHNEL